MQVYEMYGILKNVIARSEATKQSLVCKRPEIASLPLAMTMNYVKLFMKSTRG